MPSPTSMTIQSGYPFCHLLLKAVWTHSKSPECVSSLVSKVLHPSNEGKGDLPPVFESPSEGRLALRFDLQSRGPCLCRSDSDASDAGRAECIWEMTSLEEAGFRWWGVASNLCRPRLPLRPIHLGSLGSNCSWGSVCSRPHPDRKCREHPLPEPSLDRLGLLGEAKSRSPEAVWSAIPSPPTCELSSLVFFWILWYIIHALPNQLLECHEIEPSVS